MPLTSALQQPAHLALCAQPYNMPITVVTNALKPLPLPQIVAGVLLKYVNLGAGWRHRLFVLEDGVLRYYKVRLGRGRIYDGHMALKQMIARDLLLWIEW